MGVGELFKGMFGKKPFAGIIKKCPNCNADVDLGWERCHKCGVHIASMFRKKCPKCGEMNELNSFMCKKCEYNFAEEFKRATKQIYKCPICSYEADYYMMQCPACGTKFG